MRALPLLLLLSSPAFATEPAVAPALGLVPAQAPGHPLVAQSAELLTVDDVLARERAAAQPPATDEFAGYQKQTEFDNTPYRFNMKPGQKLSAAEFDAWMKARGIHIVRAKEEAPAAQEAAMVTQ
ncbi:MAG TPA: hypothetical protein VEA16_09435 [Vicinamibacterales bacterium]|nr:hypothetical protein [Vicinamibacterales bacterium]